jgi:hypothetical protein
VTLHRDLVAQAILAGRKLSWPGRAADWQRAAAAAVAILLAANGLAAAGTARWKKIAHTSPSVKHPLPDR